MKAHPIARRGGGDQRLLVLDPSSGGVDVRTMAALPSLLAPGDVIVVNDASTIPASLAVHHGGRALELRLAGPPTAGVWPAVLFGEGDWRTDTDHRPAPPTLTVGDALAAADGTLLRVVATPGPSARRIDVVIGDDEAAGWATVFRLGRVVQYAYMDRQVELAEVQTRYAGRPWAVEMPSAGRPLSLELLGALRRRGVAVVALTHAAGLSATGDRALDRSLPQPERYELPPAVVAAIARARARGGRVVAVGTSVVRALEDNARRHGGQLVAGQWTATLVLGPGTTTAVVDAVLSGVHEPGTSHHALLGAFARAELLDEADRVAERAGLTIHEFGDSSLVLPRGQAIALAV